VEICHRRNYTRIWLQRSAHPVTAANCNCRAAG
jgi:hypothetical protein